MNFLKSFTTTLILFIMLFQGLFSASASATEHVQKEINIINKSSLKFDAKSLERGNIKGNKKKVSLNSGKREDKINVLLLKKSKAVKDSQLNPQLASQFDLIATVDDVSKPESIILEWLVSRANAPRFSGEITVNVDPNGYIEENVEITQIDESLIKLQTVIDAIDDTLDYVEEEINRKQNLFSIAAYNWSNVQIDQAATYAAPYGTIRLNYNIKKALVSNGSYDKFLSLGSSVQVNPGAQLCSSNSNYACKYQTEAVTIVHQPDLNDLNSSKMVEHKPVNSGSSGSSSFTIGAGYGSDGLTTSASYTFQQNWSSISVVDNSTSYGKWNYTIKDPTQSQVLTVTGGSIHIFPDNKASTLLASQRLLFLILGILHQ
ncbi:hypothetical protein [Mesobacillus boroniphilus]|uniref:Uncharacterized protein n=1 Tax=Mesobacillus boroniphilus JCM 21738 TaxID=1294265 RepID=W4RVW8_9BACI|nr:hypothetical protein [Mesobacillus boroniphilus]GAE48282.1 hypothetical protein JCM21738_5373 [Mesobacillus boroniphilus JCM 21738]